MEIKEKSTSEKSKRVKSSIVLYVAGIIVAIVGIALLITNILYFKSLISQYVSQGYSSATVMQQLLPSQFLPAVFNSVGVYGGISVLLIGAGIINKKVTKVSEIDENVEISEIQETEQTEQTEQ